MKPTFIIDSVRSDLTVVTWCDGDAVAIDDGALFLILFWWLNAVLLHVADRLIPLFSLCTGSGTGQELVRHIKQHRRGFGRRLWSAIEVIYPTENTFWDLNSEK